MKLLDVTIDDKLVEARKKRLDDGIRSCPYNDDNNDYDHDYYSNNNKYKNSKMQVNRHSIDFMLSMFNKFSNHNNNKEDDSFFQCLWHVSKIEKQKGDGKQI